MPDDPVLHIIFEDDEVYMAVEAAGFEIREGNVFDGNEQTVCEGCGRWITGDNLAHILPHQGEYLLYCDNHACLNNYLGLIV